MSDLTGHSPPQRRGTIGMRFSFALLLGVAAIAACGGAVSSPEPGLGDASDCDACLRPAAFTAATLGNTPRGPDGACPLSGSGLGIGTLSWAASP